MSTEPLVQSEVIKRCCKILDNFDKSLTLPTLFSVQNPPKKLLDVLDGSWGVHGHDGIDLLWVSFDSSVADDESE